MQSRDLYNNNNTQKKSIIDILGEKKAFIGMGILSLIILIGGVWFLSAQNAKEEKKSKIPLMGQAVKVSQGHVPVGTKVTYSSNPPAGGDHYGDSTAHAGFYDKSNLPAEGYLVHSLEHGAVILWYNPKKLSEKEINQLKDIFNQTEGKRIMAPRESMDVSVALSSWGQVLKLKKIDDKQIKAFFNSNNERAPEQAPI